MTKATKTFFSQSPQQTPADAEVTSLANHFLVAMPQLIDSWFGGSLIYLFQHNPNGSMGLVVNQPSNITLGQIFEQLHIGHIKNTSVAKIPVFHGGPVDRHKGFVLHDGGPLWPASLEVACGLTLSTSKDILIDIAMGNGPDNFIVALGCAGWAPGQLDEEILNNTWLTAEASQCILFAEDQKQKAELAAATLGFSLSQLAVQAGYS